MFNCLVSSLLKNVVFDIFDLLQVENLKALLEVEVRLEVVFVISSINYVIEVLHWVDETSRHKCRFSNSSYCIMGRR